MFVYVGSVLITWVFVGFGLCKEVNGLFVRLVVGCVFFVMRERRI